MKKKPKVWWKDSAEKVGFWKRLGSYGMFGVLFAKGQWWIFADHRPGMDRPVWLRTEAWLNSNMVDRPEALEDIGGLLYGAMSDPAREAFAATRTAPGDLQFGIEKMARAHELKVKDDVYKIMTSNDRETSILHHWNYGSFTIRTDRPEGQT